MKHVDSVDQHKDCWFFPFASVDVASTRTGRDHTCKKSQPHWHACGWFIRIFFPCRIIACRRNHIGMHAVGSFVDFSLVVSLHVLLRLCSHQHCCCMTTCVKLSLNLFQGFLLQPCLKHVDSVDQHKDCWFFPFASVDVASTRTGRDHTCKKSQPHWHACGWFIRIFFPCRIIACLVAVMSTSTLLLYDNMCKTPPPYNEAWRVQALVVFVLSLACWALWP